MKKMLYITPLIDKQREKDWGLYYKGEGILKAFTQKGYECSWVCFDGDHLVKNQTVLGRYRSMWLFGLTGYKRILKAVKDESYDLVYIRFACTDPGFIYFLKQLKRSKATKIILEFAQYPYEPEWKVDSFLKKTALFFDRALRGKLKKYVDLAVTYTDYDSILGMSTILIQNGVDVDLIEFTGINEDQSELNLIGVAHLEYWQGFDRVIKGLADYYQNGGNEKVNFHIVGDGAERSKLEKIVEEKKLTDRVVFHGFRSGNELTEIFKKCHMGISTLGGYREEMYNGSSLKVREYVARGIPQLLGYRDVGLPESESFVHSIPNDNSPVNISELLKFYSELNIKSDEIRSYAIGEFGWSTQIEKILASVESNGV